MRRGFLMRLLILLVLAGGQIWEGFEELMRYPLILISFPDEILPNFPEMF